MHRSFVVHQKILIEFKKLYELQFIKQIYYVFKNFYFDYFSKEWFERSEIEQPSFKERLG